MGQRLIDANALKEWLGCDGDNKYSSMIMHEIADQIDEQPTIDAVPVVHGQWDTHTFSAIAWIPTATQTPVQNAQNADSYGITNEM